MTPEDKPMIWKGVTPILNVTDLAASFDWFARLGWNRAWSWGDPPTFGAVIADGTEVFLCQDGQGGRGRSDRQATRGSADRADQGVWMSVWVSDVDTVHARCVAAGLEITHPPTDEPWHVREMHVRHPDGHVLRIGQGLPGAHEADRQPVTIERTEVTVRLETRLAALLADLAAHKGMTVGACLEETLLHSFERVGGGVASPHADATFAVIEELRRSHGVSGDPHASYRWVEAD